MDVIMRLYRLGQLPASVAALEGEDSEAAAMRLPRLATSRSAVAAPSLLSRAFLRCGPLTEHEQHALTGVKRGSCSYSSITHSVLSKNIELWPLWQPICTAEDDGFPDCTLLPPPAAACTVHSPSRLVTIKQCNS